MSAPQRPLSVSDVAGLIKGFRPGNARAVFGSLLLGLEPLITSFASKPAKEQAYIAKRFEKLMRSGDVHQKFLAASVWHKISRHYAPLPRISKWLREADLPLNSAMHVFHGFLAVAFDGAGYFSPFQRLKLDRHARDMYRHIFQTAATALAQDMALLEAMPKGDAKRVALCTSQFIGRRHAPTAHILSMAEVLTQMGYSVKIFNQCLVPARSSSGFYFPFSSPKFEELNHVDTLSLDNGHQAGFWQNPHDDLCAQGFRSFVDALRDFCPGHIVSLGPANLFADLAGKYVPHSSMPTTIDIAIGESGSYGCVRPLTPVQARLLRPLGITPERLIDLPSGFARPASAGPMARDTVRLADQDYAVAMVTNRAAADIPESFLDQLEAVLERAPHIKVRIFGSSAAVSPGWQKRIQRHECIAFCGFSEDLYGALSAFDAVLNPPRLGGGTSAAYAMDLGLNLFTLPDCDVANVAGEDFVYPSISAMLGAMAQASQDARISAEKSAQAKARWRVISDREGQMRNLLQGGRVIAA